jgi:copper transport protein
MTPRLYAPLARLLLVALLAAVAAVGGGLLTAGPARAHAALVGSTPGDGVLLQTAPEEITLTFSERVGTGLGAVKVVDAEGNRADEGEINTDEKGEVVRVRLRGGLEQGSYLVTWRVMSLDAHAVSGGFTFSIGKRTDVASADQDTRDAAVTWLQRTSRLLLFVGMIVLIGSAGALVLLWRAGLARARVRKLLLGALGAAVAGTVAGFLLQGPYAAALPVSAVFRPALMEEVLGTRYGQAAVIRLALLAVLAVLVLRWTRRAPVGVAEPAVAAALAVGVLVTVSVSGHAGAGSNVGLAVASDATHLAAVSLWVGGLVALVVALLPLAADDELLRALPRWSKLAATSVAVLVATGCTPRGARYASFPALLPDRLRQAAVVKVGDRRGHAAHSATPAASGSRSAYGPRPRAPTTSLT